MKKLLFIAIFSLLLAPLSHAGFFDTIKDRLGSRGKQKIDENTAASGLKEALYIGAKSAVSSAAQVDGYFGNELIKIFMPEKLQEVADILSKLGFRDKVDNFILSMNRAAEKAAPAAKPILMNAVKEMTFDDALGILNGGDTSATDYFRIKTSDRIYDAFKPIVSDTMNEVGVTRAYKDMITQHASLPFMRQQSLDLDHYVTDQAMKGLFTLVGQEEIKIRTDPAARVTELLKKVFGR